MMLMDKKISTIDEYISACPEDARPVLEKIRQTIQAAVPEAQEAISYQIPAFKLDGQPLAYFAAWKSHIGFYATPQGNIDFQEEFSKYKMSKGSVQFPLGEAMPYGLIEKVVKHRARQLRSA